MMFSLKHTTQKVVFSFLTVALLLGCRPDETVGSTSVNNGTNPNATFIQLEVPKGFPEPHLNPENPLTKEGVKLGRYLFFEKKLSGDLTQNCASCHFPEYGFSDFMPLSVGIDGFETRRNAMPLFNLAWQEFFFWDGRAQSLEEQALEPITNPIEMNADWPTVVERLENTPMYTKLFKKAFGTKEITKEKVARAIAQFERTLISANSKYDSIKRMTVPEGSLQSLVSFSDTAIERGYVVFNGIGHCNHCHGETQTSFLLGALNDQNTFKSNGLKQNWNNGERGRAEVVPGAQNVGRMKTPSLRNVDLTGPYMHDGSIPTLDSLIEFYNTGGNNNPESNPDPDMHNPGVFRNWRKYQKDGLKAFLKSLTDKKFITDTAFSDPFQR
jgi:cytochrome c peroxidase